MCKPVLQTRIAEIRAGFELGLNEDREERLQLVASSGFPTTVILGAFGRSLSGSSHAPSQAGTVSYALVLRSAVR